MADPRIAIICAVAETSWKDEKVLPSLASLTFQEIDRKISKYLKYEFAGKRLAEQRKLISDTLKSEADTAEERRDALDTVIEAISEFPFGKYYILDLMRCAKDSKIRKPATGPASL